MPSFFARVRHSVSRLSKRVRSVRRSLRERSTSARGGARQEESALEFRKKEEEKFYAVPLLASLQSLQEEDYAPPLYDEDVSESEVTYVEEISINDSCFAQTSSYPAVAVIEEDPDDKEPEVVQPSTVHNIRMLSARRVAAWSNASWCHMVVEECESELMVAQFEDDRATEVFLKERIKTLRRLEQEAIAEQNRLSIQITALMLASQEEN